MEPTQHLAIFDEYRKELWGALKVSHEQYDKALLTLSGGGLAISITLVKELFPSDKLIVSWLLMMAWALFCASIILTVISFLVSQKALNVQLENFDKYTAGDESYLNKNNPYSTATVWFNRVSGTFFILAVIAVTTFSAINFKEKLRDVQNSKSSGGIHSTTNAAPYRNSGNQPRTSIDPPTKSQP